MVSDESIKEVIKECLEGEHSEVFKSLFSQIRRMEKEQVEVLIKKMAEEEKGKIMDLNAEIYILENILQNMEFDPLVLALDDIKIKTTLRYIKTVIASLKIKNQTREEVLENAIGEIGNRLRTDPNYLPIKLKPKDESNHSC